MNILCLLCEIYVKKSPQGFYRYLAAQVGFEPTECQVQSLMPYRLAIGQSQVIFYHPKPLLSNNLFMKFKAFFTM